jgi:hypothetical protein
MARISGAYVFLVVMGILAVVAQAEAMDGEEVLLNHAAERLRSKNPADDGLVLQSRPAPARLAPSRRGWILPEVAILGHRFGGLLTEKDQKVVMLSYALDAKPQPEAARALYEQLVVLLTARLGTECKVVRTPNFEDGFSNHEEYASYWVLEDEILRVVLAIRPRPQLFLVRCRLKYWRSELGPEGGDARGFWDVAIARARKARR